MLPETQAYVDTLRELRGKVLKTLEGLNAAALNWTPTNDATNSLFVLGTHCIGSEHGWIFETFHQGPKTRNRPGEFLAKGEDLSALRAEYERTARESEVILQPLTEAGLEATRDTPNHGAVTGRWIMLHVIRHYSEHLGQMYLTRQLWESNS
jgi:uncharacterized damage-inducible protein DinB